MRDQQLVNQNYNNNTTEAGPVVLYSCYTNPLYKSTSASAVDSVVLAAARRSGIVSLVRAQEYFNINLGRELALRVAEKDGFEPFGAHKDLSQRETNDRCTDAICTSEFMLPVSSTGSLMQASFGASGGMTG